MISIKNVSKWLRAAFRVLNHCSAEVKKKGEVVGRMRSIGQRKIDLH